MLTKVDISVEPHQAEYINLLVLAWRELDYNYEIQPYVMKIEDLLDEIKQYYTRKATEKLK